jgi:hypothetical protein
VLGLILGLLAFPIAFGVVGAALASIYVRLLELCLFNGRSQQGLFSFLFFGGGLLGAVAGVLLAVGLYGGLGRRRRAMARADSGRRGSHAYRSPDEAYDLLCRDGWKILETESGPVDEPFWWVTGSKGDLKIDASGRSQAEAWHRAVEQSRAQRRVDRWEDADD